MDWKKYSFVTRSKIRQDIVKALETEKRPSDLKKELKKEDSNISRALTELLNKGIVVCLTPDEKKGKIYKLSKKGNEIYNKIINPDGKNP